MKENPNNKIIQILQLQIFLSLENLTGLHKPVKPVQINNKFIQIITIAPASIASYNTHELIYN